MISRLHLSAIIVVAVGTVVAVLWASDEPVSWAWLMSIGASVGVTLGAMTAFDRWLWQMPWLQGWFVKRPHLWGEWNVEIRSHWEDPETGQRPDPIAATFSIRQTYSAVHLRMRSDESQGDLTSAKLVEGSDGRYTLAGIYRNEPDLAVRNRSQIHNGALLLEVEGQPNCPTELRGKYWTDRGTQGEIVAIRRQAV